MILPSEQTTRFYHIWFPLLYYVNQKLHLVDEFPSDWEAEGSVKPATAVKLRDALWENDNLREQFIAENPASLSLTDLALVESWSNRIAGNFFIFRHLKKYSVFLSSDDPVKAYGVVGLVSPIEEIVGPYLPVYVQAVLLPFEDKIIYDSLLAPYAVTFGGGYRSSLKEAYRDAQEREGIITDLRPRPKSGNPAEIREELVSRNNKVLGAFRKDLARSGLSVKMVEQHSENITRFANTYLIQQEPPRSVLEFTLEDMKNFLALPENKASQVSFKRFIRFLDETTRIKFDKARELTDFLKNI